MQAEGAQRSGESEATNIVNSLVSPRRAPLTVSNVFDSLKINSCSPVFVATVHPYKKDPKHASKIGKVSDWVRKFSDHYFIVREKNQDSDDYHYHIICKQKKDTKISDFRHNKIWIKRLDSGMTMPPSLPDLRAEVADRFFDPDDPLTNAEINAIADYDLKMHYIQQYHSIESQSKYMIRYMLKDNPSTKYEDYIIQYKY